MYIIVSQRWPCVSQYRCLEQADVGLIRKAVWAMAMFEAGVAQKAVWGWPA